VDELDDAETAGPTSAEEPTAAESARHLSGALAVAAAFAFASALLLFELRLFHFFNAYPLLGVFDFLYLLLCLRLLLLLGDFLEELVVICLLVVTTVEEAPVGLHTILLIFCYVRAAGPT
jgi:hypothetical protein